MMRPSDISRLVLLGAIWGSSFLFMKVALDAFSPVQLVAGRIVTGALTLMALSKILKVQLPREPRIWWLLAFMGLIANVVPFLLIAWGQQYITSAMASILNSTTPLFTATFAAIALAEERMNPLRALGVAIGFVGVAVIVGVDAGGSIGGQLLIVAAAALYGVGFVFSRRNLAGRGLSPLALPAGQLLVSSVIVIPLGVGDSLAFRAPVLGGIEVASVLALGVLGTGVAFYLYYRLIEDVGATSASFVTFLIPVFGVFLGWLVLGERIGPNALLGAGIVIGGITLAERARRDQGSSEEVSTTSNADPVTSPRV
jgi:drug/metabolite transporter (DMT)-like permease